MHDSVLTRTALCLSPLLIFASDLLSLPGDQHLARSVIMQLGMVAFVIGLPTVAGLLDGAGRTGRALTLISLATGALAGTVFWPSPASGQPGCYDPTPVPLTYAAGGAPFTSRSALDAAELALAVAAMPELASMTLPPLTKADADAIRQVRELPSHWPTVCGRKVRRLELVVSESLVAEVQAEPAYGGSLEELLHAHVAWLNKILLEAPDSPDAFWVLDRVMVVADHVVSGPQPGQCDTLVPHGWQVCNNRDFSWWANDRLNGVEGDIPYDIDSRWVLNDHWADVVLSWAIERPHPVTGQPFAIDHALLHELMHHLGILDLYWYDPGRFRIELPPTVRPPWFSDQPVKRRYLQFNHVAFSANDNLSNPSAPGLSSLSTGFRRFYTESNPKVTRAWQDAFGFILTGDDTMPPDGFVDPEDTVPPTATVRLDYKGFASDVTGCWVGHPTQVDGVHLVQPSTAFIAAHDGTSCSVTFSGPGYHHVLHPVFYLVLEVRSRNTDFRLPLPLPRLLINDLSWRDLDLLEVDLTNHFGYTLDQIRHQILAQSAQQVVEIGSAPGQDVFHLLAEHEHRLAALDGPLKLFARSDFASSQSDFAWGLAFGPQVGVDLCNGRDDDGDGEVDDEDACRCRELWQFGNWYLFCDTPVEWEEARTACVSRGSELVAVDSLAENQALAAEGAGREYWLGLDDQNADDVWRLQDGQPSSFFRWSTHEPNGGDQENCAMMSSDGLWNDLRCHWQVGFICAQVFPPL